MMGRKHREQTNFFYEFRLDDMIPEGHLLRRINVFVISVLGDLHEQLGPLYSDIGRQVLKAAENGVTNVIAFLGDITADTLQVLSLWMDEHDIPSNLMSVSGT
jgi:hypothetical protein